MRIPGQLLLAIIYLELRIKLRYEAVGDSGVAIALRQ